MRALSYPQSVYTQASANVRIHVKYTETVRNRTAPQGLLRTCNKKYATVRTIQDRSIFRRLQFAELRDAARNVNSARQYEQALNRLSTHT